LRERAFLNFIDSISTAATRETYEYALKRFMVYRGVKKCEDLLRGNLKEIESNIIQYITDSETRKLSRQSRKSYLAALSHFYVMNDLVLNWKKIYKFVGKGDGQKIEDKAFSKQQIQKILEKADERVKATVLLCATGGLRIGGVVGLRLKHLTPVLNDTIYRIKVYDGTDDSYPTFCSPEAKKAIDAYLDSRRRGGEVIDEKSPLIRNEVDIEDSLKAKHPRTVTEEGLSHAIGKTLIAAGLRVPIRLTENVIRGSIRHENKLSHGLRKFFLTQLTTAGVDPVRRETMAGHKYGRERVGVTQMMLVYDRPDESELLQDYLKALDLLTIGEEFRQKKELEKLQDKLKETPTIEALQEKLEKTREDMERRIADARYQTASDMYIIAGWSQKIGAKINVSDADISELKERMGKDERFVKFVKQNTGKDWKPKGAGF
jgi:integrase